MNFLNSPSVKTGARGASVCYFFPPHFPALGICPDLQLVVSSGADLWQWHMSCVGEDWGGSRGDKREWSWSAAQSESESALVSKAGHVWPKTQTAPHPLISSQKHLWVWGSGDAFDSVDWEGSKPPLNSWATRKDRCTGETKCRSVLEWWWERSLLHFLLLQKEPSWSWANEASPSYMVGKL